MIVLTDKNKKRDLIERLNMLNKRRTIGSFSDASWWNFFETDKSDLPRLMAALGIPDRVVLDNGSVMLGEEILLRGLYELVSGEDHYNIAVNVFGRDQSHVVRIISATVSTSSIHARFLPLLSMVSCPLGFTFKRLATSSLR
jgi:hypothetical protein